MICKRKGKWELASCMAVGKLCTVGNLYIISELCGSWQAMYRWQPLWQLVSCGSWRCTPLASCVAVGKPWRLAICTLLASCIPLVSIVAVGNLCGSQQALYRWRVICRGRAVWPCKLCGRGQAVLLLASCVAAGKLGCSLATNTVFAQMSQWPTAEKGHFQRNYHQQPISFLTTASFRWSLWWDRTVKPDRRKSVWGVHRNQPKQVEVCLEAHRNQHRQAASLAHQPHNQHGQAVACLEAPIRSQPYLW
jgi:hypothetical protein